ncbi:nucleotide sugar dehydrogenase [Clostridium tarantellae]|uniref:Nucleotide sugar dehydrogenase n=1 Tax=Clostridium tarantellae TaxID=39493 RepID=A0A6I1MQE4_9CLOT|nr:nucleotide sugar dehydrogenase [Clostridium tarantellae]MPQ44482.1 nucleotide sugar dehydrogenase [Clostridium tarantellae]
MNIFRNILEKKDAISIIGLGYVGLPLAVSFAEKVNVIGFDINKEKISKYRQGVDITNEVGNKKIKNTSVKFTYDEEELKNAKFHIVAVPTPINSDNTPDLLPVINASKTVGRNLTKDSIVVYESTVYPGVTEDICIPILETESGLKCGIDFKVGYSPERINPGDKINKLETIVKIVSGMDEESLNLIAEIYKLVIKAGVYKAESIKVAEAAKVIENSQRDINIAFMNELSIAFHKMNIDTNDVIRAAATKWNFLKFYPGLVGGHCIGVDPYYFIYKAEQLGYHSQIILSGRKINDDMPSFIVQAIIKKLIEANKKVKGSTILIMGITFKENCSDIRNSKVINIIEQLKEYNINIKVYDPIADKEEVKREYNIELIDYNAINNLDAIVCAVAHNEFKNIKVSEFKKKYKDEDRVLIDIKGIFDKNKFKEYGMYYWSL